MYIFFFIIKDRKHRAKLINTTKSLPALFLVLYKLFINSNYLVRKKKIMISRTYIMDLKDDCMMHMSVELASISNYMACDLCVNSM